MPIQSNIPEIIEKLERAKAGLINNPDISDAILSAINAGMGKMKFRIFDKGLDAEGNSLGNYHGNKTRVTKKKLSIASDDEFDERDRKKAKRKLNRLIKSNPDATYTEYEKFRLSKSLQIEYKDLEVEGSLRRSIQTTKVDNNKVVIAITNEETAKIAGYQEVQVGKIRGTGDAKIFSISESEYEQIREEGNEAIRQVIQKLFE